MTGIPINSYIRAITAGQLLVTTAPKSGAGLAIISLAYKLSIMKMEVKKKGVSTKLLDLVRMVNK